MLRADCYSAEEAALLDSMATGDFAMSLISGQQGRVGIGMVRAAVLNRSADGARRLLTVSDPSRP